MRVSVAPLRTFRIKMLFISLPPPPPPILILASHSSLLETRRQKVTVVADTRAKPSGTVQMASIELFYCQSN